MTPEEKKKIANGEVLVTELPNEPNQKQGKTYQAVGSMKGRMDEVYAVLSDYPNFTKFMPNVDEVTVKEQTNDFALNTYQFVEAANSAAATAKINGRVRTTSANVAANNTCTMTVIIRGV